LYFFKWWAIGEFTCEYQDFCPKMYRLKRPAFLFGGAITCSVAYVFIKEDRSIASFLAQTVSAEGLTQFDSMKWIPPTRQEILNRLKGINTDGKQLSDQEFDVLIIGGGATGTGCALDAATRGLKTALVERDDFSSGIFE
jgi:hypothetical protein